MLGRLYIKGFAIIDNLDMMFSPGLNIITGETGAGKSILIKALGLLFGAKGSSKIIHKDFPSTLICGEFGADPAHRVLTFLADHGIPYDEADPTPILIRRKICKTGRNQIWVNDVAVTLDFVKELSPYLIDIFGQHGNLRLFDPAQHLVYVDKFLADPRVVSEVAKIFGECMAIVKKLDKLVNTFDAKNRDRDYLSFRVNELDEFNPTEEDYVTILKACTEYEERLKSKTKLAQAQAFIDGSDEVNILGSLSGALRIFDSFKSELFGGMSEKLSLAINQIEEVSYDLAKSLKSSDDDEWSYEATQTRIAKYQELQRKMGVKSIAELETESKNLRMQLEFLDLAASDVRLEMTVLEKSIGDLKPVVDRLSADRSKAAAKAKRIVEKELKDLGIPQAQLEVEFLPVKTGWPILNFDSLDPLLNQRWQKIMLTLNGISVHGQERAQLLFSANRGVLPLPLQSVASGGEISRIMLAIKKALTIGAESCVLVFDEIDSGISGQQAYQVGRKIKELAESYQIICISHLPQVAAYAEAHFLVKKIGDSEGTRSMMLRLNQQESTEEIARLLSGTEITPESIDNARSLRARAGLQP